VKVQRLIKSILLISGSVLIIIAIGFLSNSTHAAPGFQDSPTSTPPEAGGTSQATPFPTQDVTIIIPNLSLSDEYCLDCHGKPGQVYTLENGDQLDLYVPAELHKNSVHGSTGIACVQCHTLVGAYPHPKWQAKDLRDSSLQLNEVCKRCHAHQYLLALDSVHEAALEKGNQAAAVCVDCHTSHEVRRVTKPGTTETLPEAKRWIPERCRLCHSEIYNKYEGSVHGSTLSEGNEDVPTCVDCHGVHNIEDPTTASFRLKSPEICAKCHTDPALMEKYGLSTDVLNSYVADFHGATVAIFEKQSPDAEVNKAVCYDCHGIHDIGKTDDPHVGLQMQENLQATCKRCHPDASANFSQAWLSHYSPSPDRYALVYYVKLFYSILIPVTLGGMGLLVVMDSGRMYLNRRKHRRQLASVTQNEEIPATPDLPEAAEASNTDSKEIES